MINKKLQKLRNLRGHVLGLEMGLNLLEQDLDIVEKHIVYLSQLQDNLTYNINLHRSSAVISVMKEYKKSLYELGLVNSELSKHHNRRKTIENKLHIQTQNYKYYSQEYHNTYQELQNESVILLFKRTKDE